MHAPEGLRNHPRLIQDRAPQKIHYDYHDDYCALVSQDAEGAGCEGNMLLNRLCESHIYMVPKRSPYLTHLKPRMERLAQHIK